MPDGVGQLQRHDEWPRDAATTCSVVVMLCVKVRMASIVFEPLSVTETVAGIVKPSSMTPASTAL